MKRATGLEQPATGSAIECLGSFPSFRSNQTSRRYSKREALRLISRKFQGRNAGALCAGSGIQRKIADLQVNERVPLASGFLLC